MSTFKPLILLTCECFQSFDAVFSDFIRYRLGGSRGPHSDRRERAPDGGQIHRSCRTETVTTQTTQKGKGMCTTSEQTNRRTCLIEESQYVTIKLT